MSLLCSSSFVDLLKGGHSIDSIKVSLFNIPFDRKLEIFHLQVSFDSFMFLINSKRKIEIMI